MWSGVWGRDESVFGDWSISLSHVLVDLKRLLFDWHQRPGSSTCLCIGESDVFFKGSVVPKRTCWSINYLVNTMLVIKPDDMQEKIERMRLQMAEFTFIREDLYQRKTLDENRR